MKNPSPQKALRREGHEGITIFHYVENMHLKN
jgi:hypothetical protein